MINKTIYVRLLDIVKKTFIFVQRCKLFDSCDVYNCILTLNNISTNLKTMLALLENNSNNIDETSFKVAFEEVSNELLLIIKTYGTEDIEDLLFLCIGEKIEVHEENLEKYKLIKEFVHPFSYSKVEKTKYNFNHLDCMNIRSELMRSELIRSELIINDNTYSDTKKFHLKVNCIHLIIHDKTDIFIINCIVDNISIDILKNDYINNKLTRLNNNDIYVELNTITHWYEHIGSIMFDNFLKCTSIKDLLVYNDTEIHNNYISYVNNINYIKFNSIEKIIDEFMLLDLYDKRNQLMNLLIDTEDQESQYISYLLYDLLSNELNGNIDTEEQKLLIDSLPFKMKTLFHNSMKETILYTKKLSNTDNSNISLEQRICLLKTSDNVKEKAMIKFKEIKNKSEDSNSKARQYLDGLINIPFKILRKENILTVTQEYIKLFNSLIQNISLYGNLELSNIIPIKNNYSSIEVHKFTQELKTHINKYEKENINILLETAINKTQRKTLLEIMNSISISKTSISKTSINKKIKLQNKNIDTLREAIFTYNKSVSYDAFIDTNIKEEPFNNVINIIKNIKNIKNRINTLEQKCNEIVVYLNNVTTSLNNAVYGHNSAKRQIERIIGQWINGENKGYCFGFEGPPGVGKTSLAKKGIADCLKDENGVSRPFSFIAIGGSANGSTLEGHNYTYVGSTWGKIVDVLMEKKCMNPIIFIDELDKVSKTEHGKEIISILTHLVDPTQNDTFQDKYFNGVDIDVSNILFVFSYNDASLIDKILLDRIHRVKFDNISLEDKIVITKQFILPEIYKKMGLNDVIKIDDDIIEFIIEHYTCEPGVRKLKELLFDIIGEINLEFLKNTSTYTLPVVINKKDIIDKYLKEHEEIKKCTIYNEPNVGVINGLWANSLGKGGILPIESSYFPASSFMELKLTGMQGDVMKESMNVAKTVAWSLLEDSVKDTLEDSNNKNNNNNNKNNNSKKGIHIHVPEGSTPKDGPSAGVAITIVMYSLLTNKKIKNDLAITGEICLHGRVTAIGGLELKILGGIKSGIKTFIFPKDNNRDFEKIKIKYTQLMNNINFIQVDNIKEVLSHVFL